MGEIAGCTQLERQVMGHSSAPSDRAVLQEQLRVEPGQRADLGQDVELYSALLMGFLAHLRKTAKKCLRL
jgi:hypothetical protein